MNLIYRKVNFEVLLWHTIRLIIMVHMLALFSLEIMVATKVIMLPCKELHTAPTLLVTWASSRVLINRMIISN